jgi:phage terminase large subunit GpA-like protein
MPFDIQKLEWQKLRERNEALDCRVYARAAAWIVGADRWPERRWAEMERELGVSNAAPLPASSRTMTTASVPATASRGRRSDWLGGRQRDWFSR